MLLAVKLWPAICYLGIEERIFKRESFTLGNHYQRFLWSSLSWLLCQSLKMKGLFLCDDITASKDLSKLISCKNILRVKKSLKSENKQHLFKQQLSLIYRKRKILQEEQQRLEVLLGG